MDSLTVNLHLMMVSFFRPRGARDCRPDREIGVPVGPPPRDRLAARWKPHGLDPAQHLLEIGPRPGEHALRTEDLIACIEREGSRLALVLLPGVQYLTGQLFDLGPLIAAARAAGAVAGVDLAHAIGNVPLRMHDWGADFAVWCSYKYLNAGPGAVGGCFVHERHATRRDLPRFAGWWGHSKAQPVRDGARLRPPGRARRAGKSAIRPCSPWRRSPPRSRSSDARGWGACGRKSVALAGFMQRLIETRLPLRRRDRHTRNCDAERGAPATACGWRCRGLLAKQCHERSERRGSHRRLARARYLEARRRSAFYNSFGDVARAIDVLARAAAP